ncbi:hypothetical protein EV360DRAFT_80711 [Lentinula raphanica]|nr:hypothetical protein EV360DRAFT_80711 [Lentinula raphanica]
MHFSFIAYIWLVSFALLPVIRALPMDTPPKAPVSASDNQVFIPAFTHRPSKGPESIFSETSTLFGPSNAKNENNLQHNVKVTIQLQEKDFKNSETQEAVRDYVELTEFFPLGSIRGIEKDERREIQTGKSGQDSGILKVFRLLETDGTVDDKSRRNERYYVGFLVQNQGAKYLGAIEEVPSPIIKNSRMKCPELEPPPGRGPYPELRPPDYRTQPQPQTQTQPQLPPQPQPQPQTSQELSSKQMRPSCTLTLTCNIM